MNVYGEKNMKNNFIINISDIIVATSSRILRNHKKLNYLAILRPTPNLTDISLQASWRWSCITKAKFEKIHCYTIN